MAEPATDDAGPRVAGVALVMLADHHPRHAPWAWLQLARGPRALAGTPGLRFARVLGSGAGGGFGLRPSPTHQGLVALFDTRAQAEAFAAGPRARAHRDRSRHWWCGLLAVTEARGAWGGVAWAPTPDAALGSSMPDATALAALTRASIRPGGAARFWRHAPAAQRALASSGGCRLAAGLGEAPLLRQCTFSVWDDEPALRAYAAGGAHGQAARAAWRHGFFSESLFVRMRLLASQGQWPAAAKEPGDG